MGDSPFRLNALLIKEAAMARGDQLGRQWKIIQTLLVSRRGKSVMEIAGDLECHPRTVYRDLEALQVAGFPLYTDRMNGKNLWSLMDTVKNQVPIPLDLAELMALYFSRNMMKVLKNTLFFDPLESFFNKIKTMLPGAYIRYLEQFEASVAVGQSPYKPYDQFKELIGIVNKAAVQKRHLEINYYTMSRKKKTRRKVAPYKIWFFNGTFYLVGYCLLRKDVRIFALDRIKKCQPLSETFEIPESFSFEDFIKDRFGIYHGDPTAVKIWFSADIAGYIKEKVWHTSQTIEDRADGSIIFEATVAGTDEIKFWIMSWGSHARVLAPEALGREIKSEAEAVLKAYSKRL